MRQGPVPAAGYAAARWSDKKRGFAAPAQSTSGSGMGVICPLLSSTTAVCNQTPLLNFRFTDAKHILFSAPRERERASTRERRLAGYQGRQVRRQARWKARPPSLPRH